jgi:hypothetical protein
MDFVSLAIDLTTQWQTSVLTVAVVFYPLSQLFLVMRSPTFFNRLQVSLLLLRLG